MTQSFPLSRRVFLSGVGAVTLMGTGAFAAESRPKLLLVILRGAMDGLGAVPKLDERSIEAHRGRLIPTDALPLRDGFALSSALKTFHTWFEAGEASVIHAIAGPWRERSHFLAQDLLESGGLKNAGREGWLNRALQQDPALSAISIGPAQPLILTGAAPTSAWSPPILPEASDDTLARLLSLYEGDDLLASALARAIDTNAVASAMSGMDQKGPPNAYRPSLEGAGRLLAAPGGPDIAIVSLDGWDTHTGQLPRLQRRLRALDDALQGTRTALGPVWANTTLACVTEFGRTVRANGGNGSDHGTASAAFLAGGALKGGKILGDWPGLKPSQLYQDRDLYPANDLHGLFKGLLTDLYGFDRAALSAVFPETKDGAIMRLA